MSEYSLEPLETLPLPAVGDVRRIYEEGFPPRQRADFAEVSERRRADESALALIRGGQPYGFAMLRSLGDTGWIYLRYFVVDRHQRGQGLGGVLWDQLTARLRAAGFTLLVFDVDDPAEPGQESDEATIRSRRISFYERHGARLLPVTGYRTPHVAPHAGDPDWAPMLLMAATLAGDPAGPRPGPDDRWVRAVVDAVYRYRWELDPGDPRLAGVLIDSE
jgi:GNAT superfamily N-acetyltransferase